MARPRDWHVAAALASNLAKFGEKARPAIPEAMKAIHALRWTKERDNTLDACVAYLSILTAGGGPEARKAVIGMLDPAGTVMKDSGPHAAELQGHLLLTLAKIGLPVEMEDRAVALRRIEEGLSSDFTLVFSAAAKVVIQLPSPAEAVVFVKPLARVLKEDFKFQKLLGSPHALTYRFSSEEQWLISKGFLDQTLAIRALGTIGTGAKEALSAVARIADQPLAPKVDFSAEPLKNRLIREAIEARRRIDSEK